MAKAVKKTIKSTSKAPATTVKKTTKKTTKATTTTAKKSAPAKIVEPKKEVISKEKVTFPAKIKSVLISQPEPTSGKSPYYDLSVKYNFKIDYIPLNNVEALTLREFRKNKVNLQDYSAVIFNSKNAIDFFFKICDELRYKMPQQAKYFCSSEQIAFYLQKYIQYRKRKVSYGNGSVEDFQNLLLKYKDSETFILPCSATGVGKLSEFLKKKKFKYSEVIMFKMVPNQELVGNPMNYDLITFFNSEGVKAFVELFPNFDATGKLLGAFGDKTQDTLKEYGYVVTVKAPQKEILSMVMAIEKLYKDYPGLSNS